MSRRRRYVKRKGRKRLIYGAIAVTFILLCFITYFSLQQSNQTDQAHGNNAIPQAAIVDHLNFTGQPNPTFVNACETILDEAGLTWKYYKGEDITVDFYRNLPSYGSGLIILRVHSAIMKEENGTIIFPPLIGLFTSEVYSLEAAQKYYSDIYFDGEYHNDSLVMAYFPGEDIYYFAIGPKFIENRMNGEFKDTVIIMMGCEGLGYINPSTGAQVAYTDMAKAFIKRGAKVYIGWDGPVGADHTDQATLDLLQDLILEKPIKEAVGEVDADPNYESVLKFYPDDDNTGNYVIPNVRSDLTMNVAYTSPKVLTKSKYTTQRVVPEFST